MKRWISSFVALSLLTFSGCDVAAVTPQSASREVDNLGVDPRICPSEPLAAGDARFCGVLNQKAISTIEGLISTGARRLVITSPGGAEEVAIHISELVEAAGVELAFNKFCLSACAQFLFLPAKNPSVQDGTLVAFHHTALSLAMLRARKDVPDAERFSKAILDLVNREVAFYESRGLSAGWLTEPLLRMRPTCVSKDVDWSTSVYPSVGYDAEFSYWVPSRQMVESLGRGSFTGYWPETQSDAKALVEALGKDFPIGRTTWKGPAVFSRNLEIDKLPFCGATN